MDDGRPWRTVQTWAVFRSVVTPLAPPEGDDAHEHDHLIPGGDEALRLKPKLRPDVPEDGEQLGEALSAPKHLLALRMSPGI